MDTESRTVLGFVESKFRATPGLEHLTPIGFVLHGQNNGVFLGEDPKTGQIQVLREKLDRHFQIDRLFDWKKNALVRRDLEELVIGVIDPTNIHIRVQESVRRENRNEAVLDYENVEGKAKQTYTLRYRELLGLMNGETGGLVIFEGTNMASASAIMTRDGESASAVAHMFFVKSDPMYDGSVVTDVTLFYTQLNNEFVNEGLVPIYDPWLKHMDKLLEDGVIKFDDDARRAMFRARILANIHLLNSENDEKYEKFLVSCLGKRSGFSVEIFGREFDQKLTEKSNEVVDGLLVAHEFRGVVTDEPVDLADALIVSTNITTWPDSFEEDEAEGILKLLNTGRLRTLRRSIKPISGEEMLSVDSLFASNNHDWREMGVYLEKLYTYASEVMLGGEVEDIRLLVQELVNWPHSQHAVWRYGFVKGTLSQKQEAMFGPALGKQRNLKEFLTETLTVLEKRVEQMHIEID